MFDLRRPDLSDRLAAAIARDDQPDWPITRTELQAARTLLRLDWRTRLRLAVWRLVLGGAR